MKPLPTDDELIRFVYHESRLIDEGRLAEWFELYTDDAFYWVPLTPDQADGVNHTSLMYEDKLLLRLRIDRHSNPRSYSLQPKVRCLHVLQQPEIDAVEPDGGGWRLRTNLIYVETQGDVQQVYGAVARHSLVRVDGALKIRLKRIDLLNCDAPLPSIQGFL